MRVHVAELKPGTLLFEALDIDQWEQPILHLPREIFRA